MIRKTLLLTLLMTLLASFASAQRLTPITFNWNLTGADREQAEVYVLQAFTKEHVPAVVAVDADYTLRISVVPVTSSCTSLLGYLAAANGVAARGVVQKCAGASVSAMLVQHDTIVWTYAATKKGDKSAVALATDLAKHLKGFLKKAGSPGVRH